MAIVKLAMQLQRSTKNDCLLLIRDTQHTTSQHCVTCHSTEVVCCVDQLCSSGHHTAAGMYHKLPEVMNHTVSWQFLS